MVRDRNMDRDWVFINRYYQELLEADVYDQPEDSGHTSKAKDVLMRWLPKIDDAKSVLDVGCGTGFCYKYFSEFGYSYLGLSVGLERKNPTIFNLDYNFTKFKDNSFDLVFSRHSLEHSPFPLITLMEWHRIAKQYLILILPDPEYYTYIGRNHYGVMPAQLASWLLRRAGWLVIEHDYSDDTEIRFLCSKQKRLGFEGYVDALDHRTYERDRIGYE